MNITYQKLLDKASVHDIKAGLWSTIVKMLSRMLDYAQRSEKYHTVIRDTQILKLYEMEMEESKK